MQNNIPKPILIISVLFVLISTISEHFFEILAAFILLLVIFQLFWRKNSPPIIIAAVGFQWLTITIGYLYLIFVDEDHSVLLRRPEYAIENVNIAYWLSIIGLFIFSLGLKLPLLKIPDKKIARSLVSNYSISKIIIFYVIFTIVSDAIYELSKFTIPGIAQALYWFSYFKWALFFIMFFISFTKNEKKPIVLLIIIVEILIGFTGYFSQFKDIIIFIIVTYLTLEKIQTRKQIFFIFFIGFIILNIGVIWSYVKGQYREYLSGGERAQIVVVSKQEAISKLADLTFDINSEKFKLGFEAMLQRIYYTEYFSATIKNIPYRRPYFEGEIWSGAVNHVLMPRLFFPEKDIIDDTEQTKKLTGIDLAGAKQGTSISVGYMAESYADFGKYFMFFPIFILGLLLGSIYKLFYTKSFNALWSNAIIFPMFFLLNINGKNSIKIMGHTFMFVIIFFLINKFLVPYFDKIIRNKQ